MKVLNGWRIASVTLLITAVMTTAVQAQQPTVVFTIRGIDSVLDDADFLGGEAGKPGAKAGAEQILGAVTSGKGLAGVDRKKPLGLYWNATADGPPEPPIVFLPVSDAEALKKLLAQLAPDFEDDKGEWSASINGTDLSGKVSGGYVFISSKLPSKLADPAKITNTKYDVALDVSIDGIPQQFKDFFLEQTEAGARSAKDNGPEPKTEAEKLGQEWGLNATLAIFKALVNDGDRLTLGVDVDQKSRLGAVDVALTAKAKSGMAEVLAAYGKIQPGFAGIGSESTPFRLILSHPSPANAEQLNTFFKAAKSSLDETIDKDNKLANDEDRTTAKGLVSKVLDIFQATLKSGSLHAGVLLESGGGEKLRVIGGAKVAKGDEAGKLLDELIKLSKSESDLAKVKIDAAKYAGARIHEITLDQNEDAKKNFGDEPGHLAFRSDSLWFSVGGDNLNALKKALDSKPSPRVATSPISLQIKPAALVILMHDDDETVVERAKKVAGKPGDKVNVDIAPIANGVKLRIEAGIDLLGLAPESDGN
jgi:hypothetical protein